MSQAVIKEIISLQFFCSISELKGIVSSIFSVFSFTLIAMFPSALP